MEFINKLEYDFHTKCMKELEKLIEADAEIEFINKDSVNLAELKLIKFGRFRGIILLVTRSVYCPKMEVLNLDFDEVNCTYVTIKEFQERMNQEFARKQDLLVSKSEGREEKLKDILSELPL